jgi:hypothetical protein
VEAICGDVLDERPWSVAATRGKAETRGRLRADSIKPSAKRDTARYGQTRGKSTRNGNKGRNGRLVETEEHIIVVISSKGQH